MYGIMNGTVALVGFGEAGRAFAVAGHWGASARVHDILIGDAEMDGAIAQAAALPCATIAEALADAPLVLSLVTADQAPLVARDAAKVIAPGALYCDMNSIAPQTKQEAARAIEAAGAHYVDVAVMAPVNPARLSVPLLISGGQAEQARTLLGALGFAKTRIVGAQVGRASAIKMIRSVMIKGMEALTAECVLAAQRAGVLEEVLSSLDASERPKPWEERADYNLDRMMIHGQRRAAEMEEVVKTLEGLGTGAAMTRGTVARQRAIGELGLKQPENGLTHKIEQLDRKEGMQTA